MKWSLWTLWLARNELIFQNIKSSPAKLLTLLKIRYFKWILAYYGLHKDLEDLWDLNPIGTILLFNKKKERMDFFWWNVEFIRFSDGAWKRLNNNLFLSDIGGLIVDHNKKVLFTFSGKTSASSPLEVEMQALIFLHQKFRASALGNNSLQLYSDSLTLVQGVLRARARIFIRSPILRGDEWEILINDGFTKVAYINRKNLLGADKRANEGKFMQNFFFAWC